MSAPGPGRPLREALDPLVDAQPTAGPSGSSNAPRGPSKLDILSKTLMSPFGNHRQEVSASRIFADLAPAIMTPRMMNALGATNISRGAITQGNHPPSALTTFTRRLTSNPVANAVANSILELDVPDEDSGVSLFRGFQATNPSAAKSKQRRREIRASAADNDRAVAVSSRKKLRESLGGKARALPKDELTRQTNEIMKDKENIAVKRSIISHEIEDLQRKVNKLEIAREKLENELLRLVEEELELDDELEGVLDTLSKTASRPSNTHRMSYTSSTRRRKGPAFLPSEHDNLPHGVAFLTLQHPQPIRALDFSAPYDVLVSASNDAADFALHVWDLASGTETRRLSGHRGPVKAIQVDNNTCLTGSEDGNVRVWDLNKVNEWEDIGYSTTGEPSEADASVDEVTDDLGRMNWDHVEARTGTKAASQSSTGVEEEHACIRVLEGHSKGITALYFENECLVTGAADKTIRQWDLNTGQCVMTMDILWAMSNSLPTASTSSRRQSTARGAGRKSFAVVPETMDLAAIASGYEDYESFVGGLQFWGYALISGSADGGVRMWDMRTGQAHRTLVGHTAPISCLQFDETHVITGSLDKTVKIWDLRTGSVSDTLNFDNPVSDLQFDTRKIAICAGDNSIKMYNRTTQQFSALTIAGHSKNSTCVRYIDRYLVSGGLDSTVKVWAL